jgi:hypothetical protein
MKKILEFAKWHFFPLVMCLGVITAFQTPGRPITVNDILIGIVLGYYSGLVIFRFESKP